MKNICLFFLLLSSPALAVLPPAWEGVRELKAILDDEQLPHYLDSGERIEAIRKTEGGWAIETNRSKIEVELIPLPQSLPGPQQFQLHFKR